jgi:CheY-like chemotaxis protein
LVRHAAEACRARIEEGGHTLLLEVPDTGLLVDGDSVRLEQVISNLLENAAKYTPHGGRITLTLARVKGEAALGVRDTGIGLESAVLERIFDLFTQVDHSLVRSGGGLGLGLAVVRRVLESHGGSIEARSAGLGQGSEFVVRLPVLSAAMPMPRAAVDIQPKAVFRTGRARRVLIIDDNADSAELLAQLARSWGHEVTVAHDGPGALALAERFVPESALVDIGLPGMDGYEVARRFRAEPRYGDLYLVALTGYGREEDRNAAYAAGFDDHLVKPPAMEVLESLLANGRVRPGSQG